MMLVDFEAGDGGWTALVEDGGRRVGVAWAAPGGRTGIRWDPESGIPRDRRHAVEVGIATARVRIEESCVPVA